MKSIALLFFLILLSGCSPRYDYTLHKPKVLYDKPSQKALRHMLHKTLGKDYRWAEEGPDSFDCSGLAYYCYGSMNMEIPRRSSEQARIGKAVSRDELKYGDLLFFDTTAHKTGQITHVGIYIGDGKFQHASNEKEGVKISSLDDPYYSRRFRIARRYIPDTDTEKISAKALFAHIPRKYAKEPSTAECENCYAVPQKVTASRGEYYIQLGSFSDSPDSSWLRHLEAAGYDYIITKEDGMNKLLAGPFERESDAMAVLPTVRRSFTPEAFIKKRR